MPDDITSLTSTAPDKRLPLNAPVLRGFTALLDFMAEDLPGDIDDPKGPLLRRLRGQDKADAIKAIRWLRQRAKPLRSQEKKQDAGRVEPPPGSDATTADGRFVSGTGYGGERR